MGTIIFNRYFSDLEFSNFNASGIATFHNYFSVYKNRLKDTATISTLPHMSGKLSFKRKNKCK